MDEPATVLIVDDEPRVLDALEAVLAAEFTVLRAPRAARRRSASSARAPTSPSSSPTTACPA